MLKKLSNADVEDEIKLWLQQSCDGGGGRRVREASRKTGHALKSSVKAASVRVDSDCSDRHGALNKSGVSNGILSGYQVNSSLFCYSYFNHLILV